MTLLLAGDIGGTKTILQWVEMGEDSSPWVIYEKTYPSRNFPHLVPMVQEFLETAIAESCQTGHPEKACLAIAGPVTNDVCNLTNLHWLLDARELEKALNIPKIHLINDFTAIGYGIFGLESKDLHPLQIGNLDRQAPIAILGAGTGLGQGFIIPQGDNYVVFPSEGGHVDFAPRNERERQLLDYFYSDRHLQRVSVERVVSGQGIIAIYNFLKSQIPESPAMAKILAQTTGDGAGEIAQAALEGRDPLAQETLKMFVSAYGSEAGNMALKFLPYGGLYLAGGIAAKILPLMESGEFLTAYHTKGRVSPVLKQVPIYVILNPQVGLIGAAICAAKI